MSKGFDCRRSFAITKCASQAADRPAFGATTPRNATVLLIALLALALLSALMTPPAFARTNAPKTFNLYLANDYTSADTVRMAQYDALGLDVDTPAAVLLRLKALNPAIKLLAYAPINGTYQNANIFTPTSKWREMWEAANANNWWLRDTHGGIIHDHPGKYTFNLTTDCPVNGQGQRMTDWYPLWIRQSVLQNGAALWDGVILDDVWKAIWFVGQSTALNPYPIDSNQDGLADDQPTLDGLWAAGNDSITARVRRLIPADKVLGGNGQNTFHQMNGSFIESFPYNGAQDPGSPVPGYCWNDKMFGYLGYFENEDYFSAQPWRINVLNAKWTTGDKYNPARTPEFERHKRFTLASTMLRDGYFSLDWQQPTVGHNSVWWEPEFDKQVGTPLGAPFQATYAGRTLWRRNYTNGVVLINPGYTSFLGAPSDSIPAIGWVDAAILLKSEMWRAESTPPAAVTDLAVSRTWTNQAEVQWTNVGDNGAVGQAVQVEARYSLAPITAANYAAATPAPGTIVPQPAGRVQTYIVTGLTNNTTYHFALKTRDLAGNWSAISNVVSAPTVVGDITAPSAITNLQVISTTSTTATVQWTSPGDDGGTGTAAQYDLRYNTVPLDAAGWLAGAQVVGEPVPGPSGTVHTLTLYGMRAATLYHFGIKTADEMPNWSPLSNTPSMQTQAGDLTPPATTADLRVAAVGTNWLTLAWTAPGDDGNGGLATSYDVRYSPNPMTVGSYLSANFAIGEPGPQLPGATQFLTLSGMGNGYTYYLALRTGDEVPNWSAVSNIVTTRTGVNVPADAVAPAAVLNLAAVPGGAGSVTLNWTAPGDDGSTGTPYAYEIRYATSSGTLTSFTAATPVVGEPTPGAAGGAATMVIGGLTDGATYYFGLKTADERGNWSGLSNVISAVAGGGQTADTTPPAAVTNLNVSGATTTSLTLGWTAPGDDATSGTASSYELRYGTAPLTEANFAAASLVSGLPAPGAAGTAQSKVVTGLAAGTTYHFALKTSDEVPNRSPLSNVAAGATTLPGDTTAPSVVGDFRVASVGLNWIVLAWSATGDDGTSGRATLYDARLSPLPLTVANFLSAGFITTEPTPDLPGALQFCRIANGLGVGYTYNLALRTGDELPNWSGVSSIITTRTGIAAPTDTTPPSAVNTLSVRPAGSGAIQLRWMSPGDDTTHGTPFAFEVRYGTSAGTVSDFAAATPVFGEPAPGPVGTMVTQTISGLTDGITYYFALKTADERGNWSPRSNVVQLMSGATSSGVEPPPDADDAGHRLSLLSATPNPFRVGTRLAIVAPPDGESDVSLVILDVRGGVVRRLHEGALPAGSHDFLWDGRDDAGRRTAAGLYFAELRSGAQRVVRKLTLMR